MAATAVTNALETKPGRGHIEYKIHNVPLTPDKSAFITAAKIVAQGPSLIEWRAAVH